MTAKILRFPDRQRGGFDLDPVRPLLVLLMAAFIIGLLTAALLMIVGVI